MYKKFDNKLKTDVMTIFAGECYISKKKEVISTVLGSCISVCLYDIIEGIGGMNHFMLPESSALSNQLFSNETSINKEELSEQSMRYGITAMEVLIAEMQKSGAKRLNLKAKIFGGGKVIARKSTTTSVGDKNIGFARAYLKMEGISIVKEDVGDTYGRKIFFITGRDSVFVKKVAIEPTAIEEQEYLKKLMEIKRKSDVTLF